MKVLVRMPNWLGDAVMATPALDNLLRHAPDAEIVTVSSGSVARLLAGDPLHPVRQRPGVAGHWCYFGRDIQRLKQDLRGGVSPLARWLGSYAAFPRDAVFSWRDPAPWGVELWRLMTRRWRRKPRAAMLAKQS